MLHLIRQDNVTADVASRIQTRAAHEADERIRRLVAELEHTCSGLDRLTLANADLTKSPAAAEEHADQQSALVESLEAEEARLESLAERKEDERKQLQADLDAEILTVSQTEGEVKALNLKLAMVQGSHSPAVSRHEQSKTSASKRVNETLAKSRRALDLALFRGLAPVNDLLDLDIADEIIALADWLIRAAEPPEDEAQAFNNQLKLMVESTSIDGAVIPMIFLAERFQKTTLPNAHVTLRALGSELDRNKRKAIRRCEQGLSSQLVEPTHGASQHCSSFNKTGQVILWRDHGTRTVCSTSKLNA